MGATIIVGAQWGDEGKGKIVDIYSRHAHQVVRYAGGANAGHTLVVDGEKVVFHLIPSGALHRDVDCVLAQGTVIDPAVLVREIGELDKRGLFDPERFTVADRAHLVLPQHRIVDELRDKQRGALGTTKRGIGPAYEDKVGRVGVRVGDMLSANKLENKLRDNQERWAPVVAALGGTLPAIAETLDTYLKLAEGLRPLIADAALRVSTALRGGRNVLMEGAQGALLDIDSGTYPFVTSSSTIAGGACTGAGIGPTDISNVVGISKVYATRVGNGPFPTEMHGAEGDALRDAGGEFGATTGRPRRCGWLDLPALRYAVRVNGLNGLALTKIDVLTGLPTIKLCTGYEINGERTDTIPYDDLDLAKPVYEVMPGWTEQISGCRSLAELPKNARAYVERIERETECPAWLVSVGADREQTILLRDAFSA